MPSILLADIGGSNSRFALADPGGRPERIETVDADSVPNLDAAMAGYLSATGAKPEAAVLAVAGPVTGDIVTLTNRPAWRFSLAALARRFGFRAIRALNDFAAVARALPRLGADDVRPLGALARVPAGVKVVLGPGTGLGVAALVPIETRWRVVASEGGHALFGPHEPDEYDVFASLRAQHGSVSIETVLSGRGLLRLAQALDPATPLAEPEEVVTRALEGDAAALAAARLFVRLLGRVSGDLALTFEAIGGVYLAGGVGRGLGTLLDEPEFRNAFEAHPPYHKLLAKIPTLLITYPEPGLLGCACEAEEL